jgi:hypothetical protein
LRQRIVYDEHGDIAYISVKLPLAEGQVPEAVVTAFEHAIDRIEPGRFQRGRCAAAKLAWGMRSDDGSATSKIARLTSPCRNDLTVPPYELMENNGKNRDTLDGLLLGAELVGRGWHASRCLVFLGVCIRKALIHKCCGAPVNVACCRPVCRI